MRLIMFVFVLTLSLLNVVYAQKYGLEKNDLLVVSQDWDSYGRWKNDDGFLLWSKNYAFERKNVATIPILDINGIEGIKQQIRAYNGSLILTYGNATIFPKTTDQLVSFDIFLKDKNFYMVSKDCGVYLIGTPLVANLSVVAKKIPLSPDEATGKSFIGEGEPINWTKLDYENFVKIYDYNITGEIIDKELYIGELTVVQPKSVEEVIESFEVKGARSLLLKAEEAFNNEEYLKAEELGLKAKSLALDIDQDEVPNEKVFAPYIHNFYIYASGIAIMLILAVSGKTYWNYRKSKKEYERKINEYRAIVEKWKSEGYNVSELEEMLK